MRAFYTNDKFDNDKNIASRVVFTCAKIRRVFHVLVMKGPPGGSSKTNAYSIDKVNEFMLSLV